MNVSRKWTPPADWEPPPHLEARARRRLLDHRFEESQGHLEPGRLYTRRLGVEKPLCAVGSMEHNGVILQSLYTKESGVSECTYQNNDQVFILLWLFDQVFEPIGYNTPLQLAFTVNFCNDERRLVVFAG